MVDSSSKDFGDTVMERERDALQRGIFLVSLKSFIRGAAAATPNGNSRDLLDLADHVMAHVDVYGKVTNALVPKFCKDDGTFDGSSVGTRIAEYRLSSIDAQSDYLRREEFLLSLAD